MKRFLVSISYNQLTYDFLSISRVQKKIKIIYIPGYHIKNREFGSVSKSVNTVLIYVPNDFWLIALDKYHLQISV